MLVRVLVVIAVLVMLHGLIFFLLIYWLVLCYLEWIGMAGISPVMKVLLGQRGSSMTYSYVCVVVLLLGLRASELLSVLIELFEQIQIF